MAGRAEGASITGTTVENTHPMGEKHNMGDGPNGMLCFSTLAEAFTHGKGEK